MTGTEKEKSEETEVMGVSLGTVAGVLEASVGGFAGNRGRALLGVAQAMRDMTESGRFGTGLARVLRYHFPAPKGRFHRDCMAAARRVFLVGELREPAWEILSWQIGKSRGKTDGAQKSGGFVRLGGDPAGPFRSVCYFGRMRDAREKTAGKAGQE